MAYVYKHIRMDTNEVFYIGIGQTKTRYLSSARRSPHWLNIVNKVQCACVILHSNVDWKMACELERSYIKHYGRKDLGSGTLVNMTDGGEGAVNRPISDKVRRILNKTGVTPSISTRMKMSASHRKNGKTGKYKRTVETLNKLSAIRKGRVPWNKGKSWSQEVKDKISQSKLKRK